MRFSKTLVSGAALVLILSIASTSRAAIESRNILKTFFETGDVPTQDQFSNLIDSYIHQTDDGLTLMGVGAVVSIKYPGGYDAIRVGGHVGVNETLPYLTLHPSAVIMDTNWVDQEGYLPLLYADTLGEAHYGYLSVVGGSARSVDFPIFVDHWVWETTPGTTLVTEPEPATAGMLLATGAIALCRRNRRMRS